MHNTKTADLLLDDLENANARATLAEKEVDHLKEQLNSIRDRQANSDNILKFDREHEQRLEEADTRISTKEQEIQRLVKKVEKLSTEIDTKEFQFAAKIESLECRNKDLHQQATIQQNTLTQQQDYESIKRDLAILRSLEGDVDADNLGNPESGKKPVEVLILERSKTLQTENTSLRMDKERLTKSLDEISHHLEGKCSEYEKQSELVKELESHVEKLQQFVNTANRGEADGGRSSTDILKEFDLMGPYPHRGLSRSGGEESSKTSSVVVMDELENTDIQNCVMPLSGHNKDHEQPQAAYMLPIIQVIYQCTK